MAEVVAWLEEYRALLARRLIGSLDDTVEAEACQRAKLVMAW